MPILTPPYIWIYIDGGWHKFASTDYVDTAINDVIATVPTSTGAYIVSGTKTSDVTTTGTTFATGADLLASNLSFVADGTSTYVLEVSGEGWKNSGTNSNFLRVKLDGNDIGYAAAYQVNVANNNIPLTGRFPFTPASGSHTLNVVFMVNAGTGTINAGNGGAGNNGPILVTLRKL